MGILQRVNADTQPFMSALGRSNLGHPLSDSAVELPCSRDMELKRDIYYLMEHGCPVLRPIQILA